MPHFVTCIRGATRGVVGCYLMGVHRHPQPLDIIDESRGVAHDPIMMPHVSSQPLDLETFFGGDGTRGGGWGVVYGSVKISIWDPLVGETWYLIAAFVVGFFVGMFGVLLAF